MYEAVVFTDKMIPHIVLGHSYPVNKRKTDHRMTRNHLMSWT